jgi:hypothetical protein
MKLTVTFDCLIQQHLQCSRSVKSKGKQTGAMIVHLSIESARVVPPEIVILMRCPCKHRNALLRGKIRISHFAPRNISTTRVTKKNPMENGRRIFRALGRRPPSGRLCRTSRQSDFWSEVIGIRTHPGEGYSDPILVPFGAADLPF